MPEASIQFSTEVSAPASEIFAYVSDLTKHGEWAANPLKITPLGGGSAEIKVGRRYKSVATVKNLTFEAELEVSEYLPPTRFAFSGSDSTGIFTHLFTFEPVSNGTKVTRSINFDLSFYLWVRFWILYFPVRRPAGRKAMEQLAQHWKS